MQSRLQSARDERMSQWAKCGSNAPASSRRPASMKTSANERIRQWIDMGSLGSQRVGESLVESDVDDARS